MPDTPPPARPAPGRLPDAPARTWRWAALLAAVAALALIELSRRVGQDLLDAGRPIVLPYPPLLAFWFPHTGPGTWLTLLCLVVALLLQRRAAVLPWRRLALAGWLVSLAWMLSLVMIDGFVSGWVEVLLDPNEYLHDLPRIDSPLVFVDTFTDFIAFGPGVDGDTAWTTHVAAHPPLATLLFWALDRVGLGGGFWAGLLCILVSSAAAVGLPATLRELGAPDAARRLVPFAALLPGAIWMAVSADGLFAGFALGGLALVARGAARRRLAVSLAGGVLLGATLYLNYGLVLFGLAVLVAFGVSVRRAGLRAVLAPWLAATAGVGLVAGTFFTLGFNWFTGLAQLRIRYYQQTASDRPFSYFVWANLAAWSVAWTPLLALGAVLATGVLGQWVGARGRRTPWSQDRVVALLALSGVAAALLADLSALSKAETERIWLTFGVLAYAGLALVRGRWAPVALVTCTVWAVLVNSLLNTGW